MAAERAAGAAVLCPGCGDRFTAGGAEPTTAEVPRPANAPRPAGKTTPRRAVALVAAALVCAGAVAWAYRGRPQEKPLPQEQRPPEQGMQEFLRQEEMLDRQTHVFISGGSRNLANRPIGKRGTGAVRNQRPGNPSSGRAPDGQSERQPREAPDRP
jgi:hypothetical protein